MQPIHTLYQSSKTYEKPMLQVSYVTIHLDTGLRQEDVISTFYPDFAAVYDHGDFFVLETRSPASNETNLFYNSIDTLTSSRISDYQIRQKEIKICPYPNNPSVGLVIGSFLTWGCNSYQPDTITGRLFFVDDKDRNFILNNGMRLALSCGTIGFEDNNSLSQEEHQKIDAIMERQKHPDWFIGSSAKKSNSLDNDLLQEIESELANNETINISELKLLKGSENSKSELDSLIGMENIKKEIRILEARLKYLTQMKRLGYFSDDVVNLHMCFMGAPGTGKTTVARILTGLFSDYGYIKKNKFVEISARQLVGNYVGQTGTKTSSIIRAAKGGVLFIDEAYTLLPGNHTGHDFSHEAVAQLLKDMEDSRGDLIVILAGYYADMQQFLAMNEGLRSRINKNIFFENYTLEESVEIFLMMLRKEYYHIDRPAMEKLWLLMKKCRLAQGFSNGRFVRNLFEKMYEQHAYRIYCNKCLDKETISIEDFDDKDVCEPIIRAVR